VDISKKYLRNFRDGEDALAPEIEMIIARMMLNQYEMPYPSSGYLNSQ